MTAPTRISLIGFSGTGKSTVARLLAWRLGWDTADTDASIERVAGRAIARIFADEGEAAFRKREGAEIGRLYGGGSGGFLVVALGGGATVADECRRQVVEGGLVVCLEATPETVLARTQSGGHASERPLLAGGDPLGRIGRLMAQRASLYSLADLTVHTDGRTPDEVAEAVLRFFREEGVRAFSRLGRFEDLSRRPPGLPPLVDAPGAAAIVRTPSGEYPAYVGWGELERLGGHVKRATGARRAFVVSDDAVLRHWGETALASLRGAGMDAVSIAVPPGDASKSLDAAGRLYDWLAGHRAERRDALVALGGGMAGDLTGFVAATYMRGVPLVQVPTSLLAMVDASIGGKTAVNHAGAKNLVGAFYQPRAVVADVATLKTLPRRELVEGFGEVIKHALIRDPGLLKLLEERLEDLLTLEPAITTDVIRRNIQIKAAVVGEDERETGGVREILNYGHTLGHALEAAGDYAALLHGEAVSAGMMAAAEIGRRCGVTPPSLVERQRRLIERAGLPLRPPPGIERERVLAALSLDKKVVAGKQRWVLLEDAGRAVVRDDVPAEVVSMVVDEILG